MRDKSHPETDAADLGEQPLNLDVSPEDVTVGMSEDDLLGYTRAEVNAGDEPPGNMDRRAARLRCGGVHMERVAIPITQIVSSLGEGMSFEYAERKYGVTALDIRAALRYLAEFGRRSF